jgi:arylsulfatase
VNSVRPRVRFGRIAGSTRDAALSLDETFDVGEYTGTPVVEDYADKMPYPFTGHPQEVCRCLEPEKLAEEERQRLREEEAKAFMAVQ